MELKLLCDCGQKYAFDVEPVNGQMPFAVNCPTCNADGTTAANAALSQMVPAAPPAQRLHINRPPPPVAPSPVVPPPLSAKPAVKTATKPPGAKPGEFNLGLGILGAFLGAALGVGLMFGFYMLVGFRFPLLGIGIGLLTGFGAKLLYRGTDHKLGIISGSIALLAVVGTLFLMYGEFPLMSIISVLVSVSMAYRISSG